MTIKRTLVLLSMTVAVFIGLAIRAYWVAPRLVDVENSIKNLWADTGDRPIAIEGAPSFQILPPEFILSNARIVTEHGADLNAEKIGFRFSFMSLFTGHYGITAININRSSLRFPPSIPRPTKQLTEKLLIDFVSFFDQTPGGATFGDIRAINFNNTQLQFGDEAALHAISASSIQLRRDNNGTIGVSGELTSGQVSKHVDLAIGPRAATPSDGRKTSFTITSDKLKLTGQGETAFDENLQFIGAITFSADTVKAVEALLGNRVPPLSNAAARLDANARLSFTAVTLSSMTLKIGASDISGNVIADYTGATPRLTGTLAATTLDLSDFANSISMKRNPLGQWSSEPIPGNLVPDIDMDLRLSSDKVIIHDLSVTSVALSLLLRNRKAELTLASATVFDGSLTGKFQLADGDQAGYYDAIAHASFDAFDLEKLGIGLLDSKRVNGLASGRIALSAAGQSSADMMSSLSGKVELESENNLIDGIDLLAFLRRIETRPVGAVLGFKSGKSEFDTGELTLDVQSGIATLSKAKLTKFPDLQVRLTGRIDLAKQSFAISGHSLGSSAQSAERAIDLPFTLTGPFDDPAFVPDFTNVSKQSGGVSP